MTGADLLKNRDDLWKVHDELSMMGDLWEDDDLLIARDDPLKTDVL
jgi:hypothetical protein